MPRCLSLSEVLIDLQRFKRSMMIMMIRFFFMNLQEEVKVELNTSLYKDLIFKKTDKQLLFFFY